MRWRRRREETTEDEGVGAAAAAPDAEPADDTPPDELGRFARTRGLVLVILVGALVVAVLGVAWVAGRRPSSVDVAPGALLVPPRGDETKPVEATRADSGNVLTLPTVPSADGARTPAPPTPPTLAAEGRRPERAGAMPPSTGAGPRAAGYADEAMAMSYAVTLAERQAMLAELRARQEKAGAEARQAEAHARESEIWVRAIERNPKLILQGRLAQSGGRFDGLAGDLLAPPPSPTAGPAGGAPSAGPVTPPTERAAEKSGPPAPSPTIETLRVYLVDRSNAASPEAVVGVGRTVVSVRPGDRLGDWTVAAITEGGVEVRAQTGHAWRLAVTSAGRVPASARSTRSPGDSGVSAEVSGTESVGSTGHGHFAPPVPLARPGQMPGPPGLLPPGSPPSSRSAPTNR
jgi:hypothetical protein